MDWLTKQAIEDEPEKNAQVVARMVDRFKLQLDNAHHQILDEELNGILLDLYPLTIANADLNAGEQRQFADDVAKHLASAKERIVKRLREV